MRARAPGNTGTTIISWPCNVHVDVRAESQWPVDNIAGADKKKKRHFPMIQRTPGSFRSNQGIRSCLSRGYAQLLRPAEANHDPGRRVHGRPRRRPVPLRQTSRLRQQSPDGTEYRYANIVQEMLATVFGCERFRNFLFGQDFIIESDHKPLQSLHLKHLSSAPARFRRMLLRLQRYTMVIKYTQH